MNIRYLLSLILLFSLRAYCQNVGVGTNSPGTKLDVNGAITHRDTSIVINGNTTIPTNNHSQVQLNAGTVSAAFTITPAATSSTGEVLVVYNNTAFTATLGTTAILAGLAIQFVYTGNGWVPNAPSANSYIQNQNAVIQSSSNYRISGGAYVGGADTVAGNQVVNSLAGTGYRVVFVGANGTLTSANNVVLTSTSQADAANLPSGNYTFNFAGSTGPQQLYYQNNMSGGIGYVLVFASPYNGTATTNFVGYSFPFTKFLIQTDGVNGTLTRATAFFSSSRLFNTSSATTLSTGGDHTGYYVFIGAGGGMGIYNTGQSPCNWTSAAGAVGSGYFSSGGCGTFPNGLLWGTGASGTPFYNAINMNWQVWIAN